SQRRSGTRPEDPAVDPARPGEAHMSVTIEAIRDAATALRGVVQETPVQYSRAISELAGAEVWLKCENLQTGGSFKIRGSYTRMCRLTEEQQRAGVLAASAGNHAQGVALAARMLGISATHYSLERAAPHMHTAN